METTPLPTLPRRQADSHKGDYGKILVIAGSETMIGAPALTARAALRCGSGLVRIAAPKEIIPAVLTICPEATAFAWSATKIKDLLAFADEHDVLAVGPGLGSAAAVKRLILELIERHHGPLVFDADALNVLSTLEPSEWPKRRNWGNIVLTPHMGEYMRLIAAVMKRGANVSLAPPNPAAAEAEAPKKSRSLADDDDDAPSTADGLVLDLPAEAATATEPEPAPAKEAGPAEPDRTPLAELLARGTGTIVVLKGHRTVITDGNRTAINTSGNPAMATAGSGDVLTGVIASLIGQKLSPLDAAVLGAHVHGTAGDLARAAIGPHAVGIITADIIERLPHALARVIAD
ncbi:MAG TPA: NAD(P)H-hydrate dehydratase [Phycisphaerae bacterium]|jgi:NAD(P)H-hydrate epimerase|nr:NAD(P)H-hydrate dehydratase [Phycisphaerae bacterium]